MQIKAGLALLLITIACTDANVWDNRKPTAYRVSATVGPWFQIDDEYWAIINHDGTIYGGKTVNDFVRFDDPDLRDSFLAFWIVNDHRGHHEVFGHAYLDNGKVCARFVDPDGNGKVICGGFRVLATSRSHGSVNPFKFVRASEVNLEDAVEYLGQQAAKIVNWNTNDVMLGSAQSDQKTAQGVDCSGTKFEVTCSDESLYFNNYVYILTVDRRLLPHTVHKPKKPYKECDDNDAEPKPWRRPIPKNGHRGDRWRETPY